MELSQRFTQTSNGLIYSKENIFRQCFHCYHEKFPELLGKSYTFADVCPTCQGAKTILKFEKKGRICSKKCYTCFETGIVKRDTPKILGICQYCNGTLKIEAKDTDSLSKEDAELLSTLIDFKNTFTQSNTPFTEEYLGIGICGGITDYGRYLKMTEEEFQQEVKQHFINRHNQYCAFLKGNQVVKAIGVYKSKSGWTLKQIF